MPLKDLQIRQGNVDLVVDVIDIGETREFNKFGKQGKVATARVKDDSGEMNLSIWNEDVDKIKPGQRIHIINGYVSEWQGEPQLTTGKLGKIEILEDKAETADEATEEEVLEEKTTDEGEHVLTEDEKVEEEEVK